MFYKVMTVIALLWGATAVAFITDFGESFKKVNVTVLADGKLLRSKSNGRIQTCSKVDLDIIKEKYSITDCGPWETPK